MPSNTKTKLRQLGQTDIYISPIGLGCWQFSEGKGGARGSWNPVSAEETNGIVQAALDGGINWFDSAEAYGWGRCKRSLVNPLNKAGKSDEDVVIATKWMPFGRTARSITKTIEASRELIDTLQKIAQTHGVTASQVALNWLINFHGEAVVIIIQQQCHYVWPCSTSGSLADLG